LAGSFAYLENVRIFSANDGASLKKGKISRKWSFLMSFIASPDMSYKDNIPKRYHKTITKASQRMNFLSAGIICPENIDIFLPPLPPPSFQGEDPGREIKDFTCSNNFRDSKPSSNPSLDNVFFNSLFFMHDFRCLSILIFLT